MAIFNKPDQQADYSANVTTIAAGSRVTGTIEIACKLHVDGELDGEVVSTNVVEISRSGVVKSELKADKLIVAGKFFGNADCELVELTASGEIQGNLTSAGLVIENGGVFEGKSLRKPPGESNTVLRFHTDDAEGEHRNDSKPKAKEEKEAQSA